MKSIRFAFAGDRDISVRVLKYLGDLDQHPLALLTADSNRASHAHALVALCPHLEEEHILSGSGFRSKEGLERLRALDLDYIIGVHFPHLLPSEALAVPRQGVLNLHPAYLPYNRGWHTPSWALLDETPIGATLHFMDEGIDTGDILVQRRLKPSPADTAHTLYTALKELEFEVFKEGWAILQEWRVKRTKQVTDEGTEHQRQDLLRPEVQKIDLDAETTASALLRRLRALTTSDPVEAAYFVEGGVKYRVQVSISEAPPD